MTYDEFYRGVKELLDMVDKPTNATHRELADAEIGKTCNEHGEPMERKWSEKKQKYYNCHRNEEGQICFGRGFLTS